MRKGIALLGVGAFLMTGAAARAVIVDTFTRADGPTVTDSVGQTELGGFDYVERGNSPSATTANGTAAIAGGELQIYGRLGTASNDTGGVYLSGFDSADLTLSATVRFEHSIAAPSSTEELANTVLFTLRSRPDMSFATNQPTNQGLVGVEIGPNGDILVREIQGATGALTNVAGANGNLIAISGTAATTRKRRAPGDLPATLNGLPFDTDQDGFIDGSESFTFGVDLSGTTLKLYVNGLQIGSNVILAETTGVGGNGIGIHKNRIASAYETISTIYVDNVDFTPIPEPACLALLTAGGLMLVRRRM